MLSDQQKVIFQMIKTSLILRIFFSELIILSFMPNGKSQDDTGKTSIFFFEPEYMMGKVAPNHSDFPKTSISHYSALNLGWFHNSQGKSWASFYNYPFTGIILSRSTLGNNHVFGNQYSVIPYIVFNTSNRLKHSVHFRIALGGSYYTKHYNSINNPDNLVIGSGFTWSFQSFMYYSMITSKYISVNLGYGYLHSSNGHTQLPNIGLNQAAVSISAKFFPSGINPGFQPKYNRIPVDRKKIIYGMIRTGIGFHEYGSAGGPVGGEKRLVNSVTLSVGAILREHIKVSIGFAGRYYHQYYYNILNPVDSTYSSKPRLNSSNLYFLAGCEFLAGHIGMNIEGGLNLFKPYFRKHFTTMEGSIDFDFWLKNLFNTKLGLNYYLINTQKKPRTNLFIGVSLNANFGQADFTEASFGVIHLFK